MAAFAKAEPPDDRLLTDPFLQFPTADGVHVVWFTEFEGSEHTVQVGSSFDRAFATVTT